MSGLPHEGMHQVEYPAEPGSVPQAPQPVPEPEPISPPSEPPASEPPLDEPPSPGPPFSEPPFSENDPSGSMATPELEPNAELLAPIGPANEPQSTEPAGPLLFESFSPPEIHVPPRIPNLGHVAILLFLLAMGWVAGGLITQAALHLNLFGVSSSDESATDIHYTLGNEVVIDLFTLGGCLLIFPPLWNRGFFNGIAWRRSRARRRRALLLGAAFLCFILALVNGWLMPGPPDAPIDKVFRVPGAAWLLFGFAVTFAPVFEEIAFRGFLLPALCTACDWIGEKISGNPPPPLDSEGQPQWSLAAMIVGSILTSIPFAGMHVPQTGYSLGPFLLLVCVSLVLCWARLGARSLGASVLVHAAYNFMLFAFMFLGTGGFKHMENM